jgi:ABC-type maltose transport system permease subunit
MKRITRILRSTWIPHLSIVSALSFIFSIISLEVALPVRLSLILPLTLPWQSTWKQWCGIFKGVTANSLNRWTRIDRFALGFHICMINGIFLTSYLNSCIVCRFTASDHLFGILILPLTQKGKLEHILHIADITWILCKEIIVNSAFI